MKLLILLLLTLLFQFLKCIKIKQFPKDAKGQATQDQDFRQANIPPIITVMMDVPGYGVSGLNKWEDYIHDNLEAIDDARKENTNNRFKVFKDRLNRYYIYNNYVELVCCKMQCRNRKI